jgi:phosphotriesterase-related protein
LIIETVTGPVRLTDVRSALAHEHMFVDFHRPEEPAYLDIDWHEVLGVCAESVVVLRRLGVDLIVDYTSIGVGRNVTLLRELSEGTGVRIVCPTGIYMDRLPPDLAGLDIDGLAAFFVRELDVGIDDTPVRAGFVKLATETGPTPAETPIHRAGARAVVTTGATIGLHCTRADALRGVLDTFEEEGLDFGQLVWAHAQFSTLDDNLEIAFRGATISLDGLSVDPDDEVLRRIERFFDEGLGDRLVLSTDASVIVNPPDRQYERDNTYVHRKFQAKLVKRFGERTVEQLLRGNVFRAYARRR